MKILKKRGPKNGMHWIFGENKFHDLNQVYWEQLLKTVLRKSFQTQEILLATFPKDLR